MFLYCSAVYLLECALSFDISFVKNQARNIEDIRIRMCELHPSNKKLYFCVFVVLSRSLCCKWHTIGEEINKAHIEMLIGEKWFWGFARFILDILDISCLILTKWDVKGKSNVNCLFQNPKLYRFPAINTYTSYNWQTFFSFDWSS